MMVTLTIPGMFYAAIVAACILRLFLLKPKSSDLSDYFITFVVLATYASLLAVTFQ